MGTIHLQCKTIKKATDPKSFNWDIKIELSGGKTCNYLLQEKKTEIKGQTEYCLNILGFTSGELFSFGRIRFL